MHIYTKNYAGYVLYQDSIDTADKPKYQIIQCLPGPKGAGLKEFFCVSQHSERS